jgi:peptidoglycan/xylan/chitin deacetylase (PgdA/CDA1 family)
MVLTTSWDDGDPTDLRVAELLAEHGLRGTFYLCRNPGRPRLTDGEIRELASSPAVEIGSHTLTHPNLVGLDSRQVDLELTASRAWLEDLIGRPVISFCYPKGLHRRRVAARVAAAGYLLGRTTMSGHTELAFDPLRMPTTMQIYPHSRWTQLRHAMREHDRAGLAGLMSVPQWSRRPVELVRQFAQHSHRRGSERFMLHLWGHSWELGECGLWRALEELLGHLRDVAATPVTNGELVQHMNPDPGVRTGSGRR